MVTQLPDGAVEFRFYRPGAHQVSLAGEFNGWHKTSLPMNLDHDGWWRYRISLAPGCYQFRYVADDEWHTDYAAFGLEPGPFGLNSVVRVEATTASRTEASRPPVVRFPNSRTDLEDAPTGTTRNDADWSVAETEEELEIAYI